MKTEPSGKACTHTVEQFIAGAREPAADHDRLRGEGRGQLRKGERERVERVIPDASRSRIPRCRECDDLARPGRHGTRGRRVAPCDGPRRRDCLEASARAAGAQRSIRAAVDRRVPELAGVPARGVRLPADEDRPRDPGADDQHDDIVIGARAAEFVLGPTRGAHVVVEGDRKPQPFFGERTQRCVMPPEVARVDADPGIRIDDPGDDEAERFGQDGWMLFPQVIRKTGDLGDERRPRIVAEVRSGGALQAERAAVGVEDR